jgi:predicted Zn-dependent peptidase
LSDHRITELSSGARVVSERMPSVRSTALGYFIGAGSRHERDDEAGLSHLIEHLLFRGTERLASNEIDEIFDAMGAEINAGTGKETTSVYSRVLDRHVPRAFEVMSDMVLSPALRDVDQERQVVLEEIAMYDDDPGEKVFDVLGEAIFGEHPLGRAIIGRAEVIAQTPVDVLAAFHGARYRPENIVVAAAGSIDHDELVAMAEAAISAREGPMLSPNGGEPADGLRPRVCFERKTTEQFHVCLGAPGLARDDERRFALRVLDGIFGGTSSSRLFQEVRERRGLAYAVYSFTSGYAGTGQVGLYVGTRPDRLAEALRVVAEEVERLIEGPLAGEELSRSKENVKGRAVLSLESTATRMNRLGSSVLTGIPILSIDELLDRIDAVSVDDVRALAAELFAPGRLSAAGIGPDEDAFRAALEPVGGELTAA